ncbi:MAG: hypothetical protein ACTSUU_05580, partial [Candidatus Thorarchaeota archaeon]
MDTTSPAAPQLQAPPEGENTNDNTPLLDWFSTESQFVYTYFDTLIVTEGGSIDNDNAKADDWEYENVYEENFDPNDNYRLDIQHWITNIPAGTENILQMEYYLAGDQENITVFVENRKNPGEWDNVGVLDNHSANQNAPTSFTYDLTGTDYVSSGEVHVRFVQPDNDPTRTSLMLEYVRVRTLKATVYENTPVYTTGENAHEGSTANFTNVKADDGNYENAYEENFTVGGEYRLDLEQWISEIPDGKQHTLQVEYYLAGNQENIAVYLENRKNPGEWDNIGVLDNHSANQNAPASFTYDLTGSDYLFGWELHIRFVQPDNDTTLTSLMLDYVRVMVRAGYFEQDGSPEYSLPILYYVAISDDPNFSYENENSGWIENENWEPTTPLDEGMWYWRVKAKDNAGNPSAWSSPRSFQVDTVPPNIPSRISPGPSVNNGWAPRPTTFSWYSVDENSGPVEYRVTVYFTGNPTTNSGWRTENRWTYDLTPEAYSWRIEARDGAGNLSGLSSAWSFRIDETAPPPPPLYQPDDNINTNQNSNITFEWTQVKDNATGVEQSGVDNYWIQIDNDDNWANGVYHENDNIPSTDNKYTYTPTLPDDLYYWRVCAVDLVGNGEDWSEVWQFRVDTLPPQGVQLTEPSNNTKINDNTPDLKWVAGEDNSTPILYRAVITYENGDNAFVSSWITDNWLDNSTYLQDNWYYWYVIARDNAGNEIQLDNYHFGIETQPPDVPDIYEPVNNASMSDNTPLLRWENVDSSDMTPPVSYYIWIATDPNFENIYLENGWIFENYWQIPDENSLPENQYWWRLCARDNVPTPNVSDNTSTYTFRIDTTPPKAAALYTPENIDTENSNLQVDFGWENVTEETDGTPEGIVIYHFQLARGGDWDNQRGGLLENFETTDNSFTYTFSDYGSYFWRVRTRDNTVPSPNLGAWSEVRRITIARWVVVDEWNGNVKTSTVAWRAVESWTILTNVAPTLWRAVDNWCDNVVAPIPAPVLDSPADGSTTNQTIITLDWHELQPADSYTYQIDNDDNWANGVYLEDSVAGSEDIVSLPEGVWRWRVKQYRKSPGAASGAWSPWSEVWLFFVDLTAPKAPDLYSPIPQENIKDNTPTFDWENVTTETDTTPENSLPVTYELEIATDSGFNNRIYWENNIENDNFTLPAENALVDNFYYWRVRGWDATNNVGPWSSRNFRVDTVPPDEPQQVWPDNDSWTKPTVNLDWSPVTLDNLGNPENSLEVMYWPELCRYKEFSPPSAVYHPDDWIYDDNWLVPTSLAELRNWYWHVKARDNAGNESGWSPTWVFYADKDAPSKVNLYAPGNQTVTNQTNITFEWEHATDDVDGNGWQSGLDNYHIQISTDNSFSTENIIYDNDNIPATDNKHDYTFTADGVYYWRVRAVDRVGWEGAWSDNRWLRIDTLPPQGVALDYPKNNTIYSDNTPDLYWWAGDDNSLPIVYRVVVSRYENFEDNELDSGWQTGWPENRENQLVWENSGYLPDDWYWWKVQARDNAGNWTETGAFYMGIEASPPQLQQLLEPIEGENLSDNTPRFHWENAIDVTLPVSYYLWIATDPGFTAVVLENGWIYENEWTVPDENALADGVYYFTYCARDNVSPPNISENMSPPRRFRIDTTPPKAATLYTPENIDTENSNLQVTFEWENVTEEIDATPEEGGKVIYLFQLARGGDWDNARGGLVENFETTDNIYTHTFSDYGSYFWRVRTRDNTVPSPNLGAWSEVRRITIARWVVVEEWNTSVSAPVVWYMAESWTTATRSVSPLWRVVDNWSGDMEAPVPRPILVSPEYGKNTANKSPNFVWENLQAADNYRLVVDNSPNFDDGENKLSVPIPGAANSYDISPQVLGEGVWYWKMNQTRTDVTSPWTQTWWFRVDVTGPAAPDLQEPADDENTNDTTPLLSWSSTESQYTYTYPYAEVSLEGGTIDNDNAWAADGNYENIYEENTTPSDNYRFNVEQRIAGIPSGTGYELQVLYYLAGDSENVVVYLENRVNPLDEWDNIGVLDNHSATAGSPALFTYDLTSTDYLSGGEVYVRFVQAENDSSPTTMMLEYLRVQTTKEATYPQTFTYSDTETTSEGKSVSFDNAKADDGNYENIYEENFAASDKFRFDVEHVIPQIASGESHELQIEYYLPGDQENITVYLENHKNPGEWDNVGVLDNHSATAGSPALFTYDLTGSDYLTTEIDLEVHIRFVQPDNDSAQTSLMLDYARVQVTAGIYEYDDTPEYSLPVLYYVAISDDPNFSYENENSGWTENENWTPSALSDGTWYWRVRARDNAGNESTWSTGYFSVDTVPPETPTQIYPIDDQWTNRTPTLRWSSVDENSYPVTYYIEISEYSGFATVQESYSGTDNFYQPTNLYEKRWYWHVKARDGAGNESEWSAPAESFRVDDTDPTAPSNPVPENFATYENGDNVKLAWGPSIDDVNANEWYSGIDNYHIQIATDPNFNNPIENYIIDNAGDPDASPPVPGENFYYFVFPDVGHYYWRVRVVDKVGHWSKWSEERIIRIATWRTLESWSGTVKSRPVSWHLTEGWSGSIYSRVVSWKLIESWAGAAQSRVVSWNIVESWSAVTRSRPATWKAVESWAGAVRSRPVSWRLTESWTGTVKSRLVSWKIVESWSNEVKSRTVSWTPVESWSGTIKSRTVSWHLAEEWSGTVRSRSVVWRLAELWSGTVRTRTVRWWTESWTGTVLSRSVSWYLIESWSGTVKSRSVSWYLIESWSGIVHSRSVSWKLVESWNGAVNAPVAWRLVESWSTTVKSRIVSWKVAESWVGEVDAPVPAPNLLTPANLSGFTYTTINFQWENLQAYDNFWLQVGMGPMGYHEENDNVGSQPSALVDGSARLGVVTGGSIENTKVLDGIYENIAEDNVGAIYVYVTSENVYEGGADNMQRAQNSEGLFENLFENNYPLPPATLQLSENITTIEVGSEVAPDYDNLDADDENYYEVDSVASGNENIVQIIHESEPNTIPKSWIDNIRILLNLASENSANYTLQIYDWNIQEWDNLYTINVGATEENFDNVITTDIDNYISPSDNIRVRLVGENSTGTFRSREDYLLFEVNYTEPAYRENVQHNIAGVGDADNYALEISYYLAGDSENIEVWLENRLNPGEWNLVGYLDNHAASASSPALFTHGLTGSDYLGAGPDN